MNEKGKKGEKINGVPLQHILLDDENLLIGKKIQDEFLFSNGKCQGVRRTPSTPRGIATGIHLLDE